jgi:hypothetical protein
MSPFAKSGLCVTLIAVASTGCQRPGPVAIVGHSIELDPGFQVFPTPRTFDGPGTVFRVDQNHTRYPVTELRVQVKDVGEEQVGTYAKHSSWKLSALANFLGAIKNLLVDPSVSADLSKTINSTFEFGEGHRERIVDEKELNDSLNKSGVTFRKDSRYFVIYETIAVPKIKVVITNGSELSAEAKADLKKVANADIGIKGDSESEFALIKNFDKPFRVFYTAEEILPGGVGLNENGGAEIVKLKPEEQPVWSDEKSAEGTAERQ